jgi:hypothetical protein
LAAAAASALAAALFADRDERDVDLVAFAGFSVCGAGDAALATADALRLRAPRPVGVASGGVGSLAIGVPRLERFILCVCV